MQHEIWMHDPSTGKQRVQIPQSQYVLCAPRQRPARAEASFLHALVFTACPVTLRQQQHQCLAPYPLLLLLQQQQQSSSQAG